MDYKNLQYVLFLLILLIPFGITYAEDNASSDVVSKLNEKNNTISEIEPDYETLGPISNVNEEVEALGNRGVEIKQLLANTTDQQTINELEKEFKVIKAKMKTLGFPTVTEYFENQQFWDEVAASKQVQKEIENENTKNKIHDIVFTETVSCSDYCTPSSLKFQLGYGYDCFYGIWTCHAYSPIWKVLHAGDNGAQRLIVGNPHDWITIQWIIKSNKATIGTYHGTYTLHSNFNLFKNGDNFVNSVALSSSRDFVIHSVEKYNKPVGAGFKIYSWWAVDGLS